MPGAFSRVVRRLAASGLAVALLATAAAAATADAPTRPATEEALVEQISTAIETRDYGMIENLVFWKDTGKIKKRIVRFHLNRNLGRAVKSVTVTPFDMKSLDSVIASGKFAPNMEMTRKVTVVFDEPADETTGAAPSAVFLVGKRDDVFRIGLVNRAGFDDDDD